MKSRSITIELIIFLFASMALKLIPPFTQASFTPVMYVNPPSIIDSGLMPGDSFTVDLMIADTDYNEGTEVYSWAVLMIWNPAVLDIDDVVTWGDFMDAPRIGPWGLLTSDAEAGQTTVYVQEGSRFWNPDIWGGDVLIQDGTNNESNTVVSALDNQLTLQSPLANTYTVEDGGGVYPHPDTLPASNVGPARNRISAGVTTLGYPPGVSGSGWLCTLTFYVKDYGETALDIDDPFFGSATYIINTLKEYLGDDPSGPTDPGNFQAELLKGSGFFSNVGAPSTYDLTIGAVGSGTTDPAPSVYAYDEGTVVDVTAIPDSGYMLDHWELDNVDVGSANPHSVTIDADCTLTAFFAEIPPVQYVLTIGVVGSGTTDPASGTYAYDEDTGVTIHAVPDSGWMLDHWELDGVDVGDANPYSIIMDTDYVLTAFFVGDVIIDTIPPVADAGPDQTVNEGTVVMFDGSASHDENSIASYTWTFTDVTPQTLTGEKPTYTFTTSGTYIITLNVTDPAGNYDTDNVSIIVSSDNDGDGTPDVTDPDDDNDGVNDEEDAFPLDSTETVDTDGDGVGNNADTDDDDDGMPDNWEIENGLDPLNAADASLDPDGDSLTNFQEYQQRTDPHVSDAETLLTEVPPLWIVGAVVATILITITVAATFRKRRDKA